jgi:hypothetical protein
MKGLREKINTLKRFLVYSENAPKLLRTHVYASPPRQFDMHCPRGIRHKIEYSEFEKHIWCYTCEKDYFLPWSSRYTGIFSGPIPINVARLLGCDFRRINLETKEITDDSFLGTSNEPANSNYNATWVQSKELMDYDNKFSEELK